MVIKRLFTTGGPSVSTEMTVAHAKPGGRFACRIEATGGTRRVEVQHIAIILAAKVYGSYVDFHRIEAIPAFTLNPGSSKNFAVTCDVPWEAPLTLTPIEVGLRTELAVAHATDRSDLDPVHIDAGPAQQHILDCLGAMGFSMQGSSLEKGMLQGVRLEMPFYQEIIFEPGKTYAAQLRSLKLTFVNRPDRLHVVVELDRKVTLADRDVFGHFAVNPAKLDKIDWSALLESWLAGLAR